jgi:hypothetical protein
MNMVMVLLDSDFNRMVNLPSINLPTLAGDAIDV